MFRSKLSPEQWAEVRSLRAGGVSLPALSQRFGIARATIGRRALKEGWTPHRKSVAGDARPSGKAAARPASPATADVRRRLAVKLYRLIEREIDIMELRMKKQKSAYAKSGARGEPPSVTQEERNSFAALINSINQVTEMASEPASAADGRRNRSAVSAELAALSADIEPAALGAASEKDEQRAQLAEQLAKVVGPA